MKFMYYDIFYEVLENFSDKTSTDIRAICATHNNHSDLGIHTPIDSKWSIHTPAGCNST
jgi:hypothetical protein